MRLQRGSLGGLSAAHCAGSRRDGTTQRRNTALRRPPAPGVVLGRVQRVVQRSAPLDALLLPAPQGVSRTATPVVDRGISRPPWIVAGPAKTTGGRRMCYTGRTSGVDRCGTLLGRRARPVERLLARRGGVRVRCTTVRAAEGDSGGPVYTRPRSDGTVRALGITTLVFGLFRQMCFHADPARARPARRDAGHWKLSSGRSRRPARRVTSSRTTSATSAAKRSIERRTSACSTAPTLIWMM